MKTTVNRDSICYFIIFRNEIRQAVGRHERIESASGSHRRSGGSSARTAAGGLTGTDARKPSAILSGTAVVSAVGRLGSALWPSSLAQAFENLVRFSVFEISIFPTSGENSERSADKTVSNPA